MLDADERFVGSGPLRIWTERVGDPGLPAVLMVMGMDWIPLTWPGLPWAA
jgi:hypothetical protein